MKFQRLTADFRPAFGDAVSWLNVEVSAPKSDGGKLVDPAFGQLTAAEQGG
jgi:hypothetical protein